MARMWASVNDPRSGDPRCPLVPKLTSCPGSPRSGKRSKYSPSSRTGSISISLGASLPASGEIVISGYLLRHWTGLGIPDLGRILGNRSVARELSRTGDIQNRLARPCMRIRVECAKPLIRVEVGFEVRQMHVVVAVRHQRIVNGSKNSRLEAADIVGSDHVQSRPGFRLVVVMPMRAVPATTLRDLLHSETKQKEVFLAGFFRHLDGRSVARADRQGSIHHEFHIARAAGLVAGGRDLVGNVRSGDQPLRERNVVIGQEDHFETTACHRIAVDRAGQVIDQFYYQLGEVISGCRLASKEEGARRHFDTRIFAYPIVENDDAQRIEQLSLVFVDALDLAVEDGVWVDHLVKCRFEP